MQRMFNVAATAVFAVVALVRSAVAAEPLVWQIDLVDGGRVVGPIATEAIEIRTEFGSLRVPIEKLTEAAPGLVSRADWLRRVDGLITALGDAKADARDRAERELIDIGPRVKLVVEQATRDADTERRLRARRVLRALAESKLIARPWPRQDVVMAAGQRFAGKITNGEIELLAAWGNVRVPLADIESLAIPASRRTIDLLGEIDVDRDAVSGGWSWDGGTLVAAKANRSRLQIPIAPPAEYELRLTIVPLAGRRVKGVDRDIADSLFLGIVVGTQQTHVAIDAFTDIGGPFAGFDLTDGKRVHDAPLHTGSLLDLGREAEIVVEVRRAAVSLAVDKKLVFDWRDDPKRLSISPAWTYRDSRFLGIGCHQTSYKVREFRLTPIDDAPPPANVKPGEWIVRLGDGSLLVGAPREKQTLSLREASATGDIQSTPLDQIKRFRRTADGQRVEVETEGDKPWHAMLDKDAAAATMQFDTRWGNVAIPLPTIREAQRSEAATEAKPPPKD